MGTYWDDFIDDYSNKIYDWSLRFTLEAFFYYCKGGSVAVDAFLEQKQP